MQLVAQGFFAFYDKFGGTEEYRDIMKLIVRMRVQGYIEMLKPLEEHYRLIIPAQDGFYDGSSDFTSFADQAGQIEE